MDNIMGWAWRELHSEQVNGVLFKTKEEAIADAEYILHDPGISFVIGRGIRIEIEDFIHMDMDNLLESADGCALDYVDSYDPIFEIPLGRKESAQRELNRVVAEWAKCHVEVMIEWYFEEELGIYFTPIPFRENSNGESSENHVALDERQ